MTSDAPSTTFSAPPTGSGGWQQYVHLEQVWGTVVVVDIRDDAIQERDAVDAVASVAEFFHDVDAWFSTYRVDTPITMIRNGLWDTTQAPPIVGEVLDACSALRTLTGGAFDPWAAPGGVDPSGYVKGWAADVGTEILAAHGYRNVSINAAGDVSCRGLQAPGEPWQVGIRHPEHADQVVRVTAVTHGSVATSGLYERGAHIVNPFTRDRSMALDSATVVGPDGGMADALATACLVKGLACVDWFAGLPDWSAYLIQGSDAHFFGPAFDDGAHAR